MICIRGFYSSMHSRDVESRFSILQSKVSLSTEAFSSRITEGHSMEIKQDCQIWRVTDDLNKRQNFDRNAESLCHIDVESSRHVEWPLDSFQFVVRLKTVPPESSVQFLNTVEGPPLAINCV